MDRTSERVANSCPACYNDVGCSRSCMKPARKRSYLRYCLMMKPHANARYAASLQKLALAELQCILDAWGFFTKAFWMDIAGVSFLVFETDDLPQDAWKMLSRHSTVCFAASMEGDTLRPVRLERDDYLPSDLAEVLKYKGKTNVDFTAMMLHCALAASDFSRADEPLVVLDPVCGRGTSLFCAAREGYHAVGADIDERAIAEADTYFSRYVKYHKMKHQREIFSVTLPRRKQAREVRFTFANSPETYRQSKGRTLRLLAGDTRSVDSMLGEKSCHVMIGDLPYGVQHAPKKGKDIDSFQGLLPQAMAAYQRVLKDGGTIALSFNTYTLHRRAMEETMEKAGFTVLVQPPYHDFSHWVEQAVNRDFVVARKEKH